MRQVDADEPDRRPVSAVERRGALPRQAPRRRQPFDRLCHPGRQSLSVADAAPERRVSARAAHGRKRRAARARRTADPPGRPRRLRGQLPTRAVRRHASARQHHPHPGLRARSHPDGRAVRPARCADPADPAEPVARPVARGAQDHHFHHPRSERGSRARRPRGGDVGASGANQDHRAGADPAAAQPVRDSLRRARFARPIGRCGRASRRRSRKEPRDGKHGPEQGGRIRCRRAPPMSRTTSRRSRPRSGATS